MLFLLAGLALSAEPFPPARITVPKTADTLGAVMATVESQTGLQVLRTGLDFGVPVRDLSGPQALWPLVTKLAGGSRIRVEADGRRVAFVPGPPAPAALDGSFRLAVRSVTCRHDYDAGPPVCEVAIDLHWDPRLAVVRVGDAGSKVAVTGAMHHSSIRLTGIPRSAISLPPQELVYSVTAAERMLSFTVPDLTAPKPQTIDGVTLTPKPARRLDAVVEFPLDLRYPDGHPEFESFESWTAGNRCRLVHRDGRTLTTDDQEDGHNGRTATAAYRFRATDVGDLSGWSLVLDTPGPLREFPVRFTLRDIPLP